MRDVNRFKRHLIQGLILALATKSVHYKWLGFLNLRPGPILAVFIHSLFRGCAKIRLFLFRLAHRNII